MHELRSGETAAATTMTLAREVRRIGVFTGACLLISNMIGTGVFGTTGFMAADLGRPSWILGLWALGAFYALCGAFAYGELGAALPRAGGEYVYIREAFGPLWGFLSGWTSFTIAFSAAIAVNAVLFAGHVRELVPAFATPLEFDGSLGAWLGRTRAIELLLVWFLTAVHCAGLGAGGWLQRFLTVVKVGAILLLVVAGFAVGSGDWANLAHTSEVDVRWSTALVSFMYVTFSYSGWNATAYVADELEHPTRDLPRSMVLGTLTVAGLYLALNVLYLYAQPVEAMANDELIGNSSAQALFGGRIGRWFTAFLAISIAGATSAMTWAGPRVYRAMAEDGAFPRFFAGRSAARGVPVRSIVLQSAWVSLLVLAGSFETLVKYASSVLIFFAGLGVLSVFVLRKTRPDLERPYRAFGYPVLPALYLVISAAILGAAIWQQGSAWSAGEPVGYLAAGILTVLGGIPFYFWFRRNARGAQSGP